MIIDSYCVWLVISTLPAPKLSSVKQRGDRTVFKDLTEQLVYQGDWSRNIPACVNCHGPSGLGLATFPRLANQQASYIEEQLLMWQTGMRRGDHDNVMGNIAKKLTAKEITLLAQYFSTIK